MIAAPPLPLAEVTRRAFGVLARELGPVDAARFVAQFSNGTGDYTADRDALFAGRTVAELADDIRAAMAQLGSPGDGTHP
jgi:hypothetical protein